MLAASPGQAFAQSEQFVRPSPRVEIATHVSEASQQFGIPEHWIYAVIRAESAGRVRAVSRAGAMGLMQLMPGTWSRQRRPVLPRARPVRPARQRSGRHVLPARNVRSLRRARLPRCIQCRSGTLRRLACRTAFAATRNAPLCRPDCAAVAVRAHVCGGASTSQECSGWRLAASRRSAKRVGRGGYARPRGEPLRATGTSRARSIRARLDGFLPMKASLAPSRSHAFPGETGRISGDLRIKRKEGWRDKSTAVGRGAGGWFCGRLCAISAVRLQALGPKSLGFSMLKAPSADFPVYG